MRRGRAWSGRGGGGPRQHFRGGGAGFGPRANTYFNSPPPRLNRPLPWTRPNLPSSGPRQNFYENDVLPPNFSNPNFQNIRQRGYHHHSPRGIPRGGEHNRGNPNRNHLQLSKNRCSLLSTPKSQHISDLDQQDTPEFEQVNLHPRDQNEPRDLYGNSNFRNVKNKVNKSMKTELHHPEITPNSFQPTEHSRYPPRTTVYEQFQPREETMLHRIQTNFCLRKPFATDLLETSQSFRQDDHLYGDHSQPTTFAPKCTSEDFTTDEYSQKRNYDVEIWDTKPPCFSAQTTDFSGQRPPATDHYVDSSRSLEGGFDKSVGDTVDIIKRRLQSRHEKPQSFESQVDTDNSHWSDIESPEKAEKSQRSRSRHNSRRCHRSKSEKKCARMKKKIVHELFKMDRSNLHKLIEDPRSSAKFEFALSSLITESRNSLNRQMRSAAEKSLSGNDIRTDSRDTDDTVYEDTFMAQMEGVLDPRDIVMLSDIKPMVMAEINKVLQLDEYSQSYSEDYYRHKSRPHLDSYDSSDPLEVPIENVPIKIDEDSLEEEEGAYYSDEEKITRRNSREKKSHSRKLEFESNPKFSDDNVKVTFPDTLENISDDEYTFADLDKQYHVAVEYSMIEQARKSPTQQMILKPSQEISSIREHGTDKNSGIKPKKENTLDKSNPKILPMSNLCTPVFSKVTNDNMNLKNADIQKKISNKVREEDKPENVIPKSVVMKSENKIDAQDTQNKKEFKNSESRDTKTGQSKLEVQIKLEKTTKRKDEHKDTPSKKSTPVKSSKTSENSTKEDTLNKISPDATHKREPEDKISHRKEKRKKTESKADANKNVLNKNIIINVNDCASNNSEKCDSGAKSVFNLYFSKSKEDQPQGNLQKTDEVNVYSDKYVKRKTSIERKEKDVKHNTKSPSCSVNMGLVEVGTSSKQQICESKTKLLPINMFEQTPKKQSNHVAMRNTAIVSPDLKLSTTPILAKQSNIKVVKKSKSFVTNSTQTIIKQNTRTTQTKEQITKKNAFCQTDASGDCISRHNLNKSEDVMERMKQIDLEIQQLLQEKFKLYKNLENVQPDDKNVQALGMSIVNMNPVLCSDNDDNNLLDTFTNMSEEELQEIALQDISDTVLDIDIYPPTLPQKKKKPQPKKRQAITKKNKNVPKMVIKRNQSLSSSESHDEYQVVKKIKKQKRVTFLDEVVVESVSQNENSNDGSLKHNIANDRKEGTKTVKKTKKPLAKKRGRPKTLTKVKQDTKMTVRKCSVILSRIHLNERLNQQLRDLTARKIVKKEDCFSDEVVLSSERQDESETFGLEEVVEIDNVPELGGVEVVTDMMDVSEDIVIGEAGSGVGEVVDNGPAPVLQEQEASSAPGDDCKLYDFTPNGEHGTDMVACRGHGDAVVAIEVVENGILAASVDGNVYHYCSNTGRLLTTLRGSNFALTCLSVVADRDGTTVYTGCLDSRIRYYDLQTGLEKGPECNVLSPIQSMDRAWDTIFVGTRTGFVLQFECKNNLLIPVSSLKFCEQTILALRAVKEGPRKVLLVASRSAQVAVKDAQTGLLLRTLEGPHMTVYSLLLDAGRIYCGTNTSQIQVFDFTTGASCGWHASGKGAVCVRGAGGLLLAGCYDGCVYVFRRERAQPIAQLRGPSDMLLSLAVLPTKIIASYKNKSMYIWKIPASILQEMVL